MTASYDGIMRKSAKCLQGDLTVREKLMESFPEVFRMTTGCPWRIEGRVSGSLPEDHRLSAEH